MKIKYEQIKQFMSDYCRDYSTYANDAETMDRMDKYWAVDFKVTAYFRRSDGTYPVVYKNRKEFQEFLIKTHIAIKDTMTVRDIIIDEKAKKVALLVKIVKENRETDEKIEIDGMGYYQLTAEGNSAVKIKSLDFFWDAPEKIKNLGSKE